MLQHILSIGNKVLLKAYDRGPEENAREWAEHICVSTIFSILLSLLWLGIVFEKLCYTIPQMLFPSFGKQLDVVKRMSFEWPDRDLFQAIKDFHNAQAFYKMEVCYEIMLGGKG